ncbi:MAG: shikimate dehydrogenase [bacterium]|nr:shikimate dehydrogenase [Gammaproteobacteria bacterium]HIL97782.1 shikimate dehydrogenase [Pseudomonadales bacterium]
MKLLAVLGNPVSHSRSPEIHQAFATACGLEIDYRKIRVPKGRFDDTARKLLASGAVGFNITVPNKNDAFRFCDQVTEMAQKAQAVNTVQHLADGRLVGHNTDGPGLVTDITVNLGWSLADKRVLVVGAGGAVQGVAASLLAKGPATIDIVNRTHQRAIDIMIRENDDRLRARHLHELGTAYDLVISGSSAGLETGSQAIELPGEIIGTNTRSYDMIYARELTPFLRWCRRNGAREYCDGLGMLVEQAALAFQIWFGQVVATSKVIKQVRGTL